MSASPAHRHPFVRRPHRTLVALSVPVLLSMIAEPLTGIADTAFVKELGEGATTALGVATVLLSSVLWIFNFLSIGTQTEVARAEGAGDVARGREITSLALLLSAVCGVLLCVVGWLNADSAVSFMKAEGQVRLDASSYLGIRLLGSPWVIVTATAFGALRGLQDMRTPVWIAVGTNALNIGLDALLIFGLGPIPALGIEGAAWATVISQVLGAVWALSAVRARLGFERRLHLADAKNLFAVGRDLVIRTGLLLFFIVWATRAATSAGTDAGDAHQAIRSLWMFTALALDAYATTAQSLVSYFLGADARGLARRCAGVATLWAFGTGVALALVMGAGAQVVADLLVPRSAHGVFVSAWLVSALAQPVNALCFVTDGIHWGTGDYRYLRNGVIAATAIGILLIEQIDLEAPHALDSVWWVTAGWITVRATWGVVRVWPGVGNAPLARPR